MSTRTGPVLDNTLDASSVVLRTLRDTCEVPAARIAADIAADIVSAVQVRQLGIVVQMLQRY